MKTAYALFTFLIIAVSAFAQTATVQTDPTDPNKQVVEVRINQVQPNVPSVISPFVKDAKDLGQALGGGLKSLAQETKDMTFGKDKTLVQGLDELSKTDAGKFTMAAIAWKVAGSDALTLINRVNQIVIGVPFIVFWNILCLWFYRRNFTEYAVLKTSEGPFWYRKKVYATANEDSNWSGGKCTGAVITGLIWAAVTVATGLNIVF